MNHLYLDPPDPDPIMVFNMKCKHWFMSDHVETMPHCPVCGEPAEWVTEEVFDGPEPEEAI